jgi:hypothetical protein
MKASLTRLELKAWLQSTLRLPAMTARWTDVASQALMIKEASLLLDTEQAGDTKDQ